MAQHATTAILVERPTGTEPPEVIHRLVAGWIMTYNSEETRRTYRKAIRPWLEFAARYQLDPLRPGRMGLDLYARELADAGYANATWSNMLVALRSFYNYCYDLEVIDANPARRVKLPRRNSKPQPALNESEMHRFLEAADADRDPYTPATLLVMALCATRISETLGSDIGDVRGQWQPVLRIHGKGDKDRDVFVPPRAMEALHVAWDGRELGPLLLNQRSVRITRTNVRRMIDRVAARSKFEHRGLSPHAMRRSAIQIALARGVPLRDVQLWAGHETSRSTERYDQRILAPERSPGLIVQSSVS